MKSVWKRCHMDLPGSTNLIQRKASRTSRLRPIIMWTRLFFKLPLQHGEIYGIAVPASQVGILRLSGKRFEPSIRKKRKILIPTWVYSCCVRYEENRSENCFIVFSPMGVSRMGYGYCNIIYGQIRQKSLIFFVYL